MLSNSSSSLFWPAHSITAPPFLCSAGASHRRAAFSFICRRIPRRSTDLVLLFGRRISSPRRILFHLPAHSPPIHQFGVVPFGRRIRRQSTDLVLFRFAGAFPAGPPIWCCCSAGASHRHAAFSFVCRCICRRSTDLVLFCLAGIFATYPPNWCCSVSPAHLPRIHRFGVVPFGQRIPRRAATDLVLFHLAGTFPAKPPPIWRCFT